jgi:lipopolysaccharide transport system ATP-binding protein
MAPIIEVRNLSKKYQLGTGISPEGNIREVIMEALLKPWIAPRRPAENSDRSSQSRSLWALKDINLEIEEGEVLGIIGHNGAGKTTLLKILSRITDPTEGYAKVRGRLASLLEVGTGSHPELTGRENIYLNGAILGMRKAEIDAKFEEIVEFSEIREFLDTPVKRYSTGMFVRLAFAVAAHLDPEILVVDEVLAVGDTAFQRKCIGKMGEVSRGGRTVLFVSHNLSAVESLCRRGIVLRQGRLVFSGTAKEAIAYYLQHLGDQGSNSQSHIIELSGLPRSAPWAPYLKRMEFYTDDGRPLDRGLRLGARLKIRVVFDLRTTTPSFEVKLGFDNAYGQRIFCAYSAFEPTRPLESRCGEAAFVCDIPSFTLMPGEYRIGLTLYVGNGRVDVLDEAARLTVLPTDFYGTGKAPDQGVCVLRQRWYLE